VKEAVHLPNPLPPARNAATLPQPGADGRKEIRVLYLGRIEARKGILTLLAGFLPLAKRDPDLRLALVGAEVEPYAAKVRRLLEQCPPDLAARVTWEAPCPPDRLPALMARFDILAVPSLWENSPYVYFEGMAAGLLCAGSATGEMKEAAEATGGLLAAPGEPEEWTRVLGEAAAMVRDPSRLAAAREAQAAYLDARREGIPGRMAELYRGIARDASDGEAGP
jgi:glycosyltransferase involved in cell wall biosynthesis